MEPNVNHLLAQMRDISTEDNLSRRQLLDGATALLARLETPWETTQRLTFVFPAQVACIRIAAKLGLFEKWVAAGSRPKNEVELLKLVQCDSALFHRVVQHLVSTGVLARNEQGLYQMSRFAEGLAGPLFLGAVEYFHEITGPVVFNLPEYVESLDFKNPTSTTDDNWKHLKGVTMQQHLISHPRIADMLGNTMGASMQQRGFLSDLYPVAQLGTQTASNDVLLVDCGGSFGHDIENFRARNPELAGRLIVQDLPAVIEKSPPLNDRIEKMPHDIFQVQPVKGAVAYYIHRVLHDYPDKDALRMLQAMRAAMTKGRSKLLIQEFIVHSGNPSPASTTSDIVMMAMNAGAERSEETWRRLLHEAGFEVLGIWGSELLDESVIEAVPR